MGDTIMCAHSMPLGDPISTYRWLKNAAQSAYDSVGSDSTESETANAGNAAAVQAMPRAVDASASPILDAVEASGPGPAFDDGGGYSWRADGEGGYECVGAPGGQDGAIGLVVTAQSAPDAFALLTSRDPAPSLAANPSEPAAEVAPVEAAPSEPGSAFDLIPGSNRFWDAATQARDAASGKAGELLELGVERVLGLPDEDTDIEQAPAEAPPAPIAVFEVTDGNARLRDPDSWATKPESLTQGSFVQVHRVEGRFAEVSRVEGDATPVWTSVSNLSSKATFWEPPAEEVEEHTPETEVTPEGSTWTEWAEARRQAAARDAIAVARWLTGADRAAAAEEPAQEAAEDVGETAPDGAVYDTAYTIAALGAMPLGRDKRGIEGAHMLQPATQVWLLEVDGAYARIQTLQGQATHIDGSEDVWLNTAFIGGFGTTPVSLDNEQSEAENAENSAAAIESQLPEGRSPGSSPYAWKFKPGFELALDGTALQKSLLTKVQMLCEWAIANDMVTGDIGWSSGMRSPARAHQMCVAWNIQYGQHVTFDA
ncbi:MAG: hypothetical protein AB8H79_23125, partial [Myxococcota bacterium]